MAVRPVIALAGVGALTVALGAAVLAVASGPHGGTGAPTSVTSTDPPDVGVAGHPIPAGDTGSDGGRYGPVTIGKTHYAIPAGALFVSPAGHDGAAGSFGAPWRTVTHAVAAARPGATIVVRGGVYHESVATAKRVTLQSYPGEAVWFDGSERVGGWAKDGPIWRKDGWTTKFDHTDPTAHQGQFWHEVDPRHPMANWPDEVFVSGRQLRQVASRAQVTEGTFFADYADDRLYIGSDPSRARVDASTMSEALSLNPGADGSIVRGIGFRRYATPMPRVAAVKGFADNLMFENDAFDDTAYIGIAIKGSNIVVRHNAMFRNGELGIAAYRATNALIIGNLLEGNNDEHFEVAPQAGAIKSTQSPGLRVIGNKADYNYGPGIWLDDGDHHAVIARNVSSHNDGNGIVFEISNGVLITGNLVVQNARFGIRMLDSSNARIWNNSMIGNLNSQIIVSNAARSKHEPWMNWTSSDVQIFNNLMQSRPGRSDELLTVQDVEGVHGAGSMATVDHNAYYRPGGSPSNMILWVDLARNTTVLHTLADFRAKTGREAHGVAADAPAPLVPGPAYRLAAGTAPARSAAPIPPDVAALLGTAPGSTPGLGALF